VTASQHVEVSVVVPTGGEPDSLERLLGALDRQTIPAERYDVVVVVNPPNDDALRLVERHGDRLRVQALGRPRRGRAAACNAGLAVARGTLVAFLDDDMRPVEDWLERHLEAHARAPSSVVLGAVPVLLDRSSQPIERWVGARFAFHHERLLEPGHSFHLRDFFTGNASLPRLVLEEVGGFDEAFGLYGHEDLELFIRLRRAGIEAVFEPRAIAFQRYTKTFSTFGRDMRASGATAVQLARRHPDAAADVVAWRTGPPSWERLKRLLLAGPRRRLSMPVFLTGLEATLRRLLPGRTTQFYSLAADYFFWLGVEEQEPGVEAGTIFHPEA
jgi:GT2 family glycosyltransferase